MQTMSFSRSGDRGWRAEKGRETEKGQTLAPTKAGQLVWPPPCRRKQPGTGHDAPVKSGGAEAAA